MSDEKGSLATGLLLFLVGAAAGAVVAALTTPKSGPELRGDIKSLTRRLKRNAREAGRAICPMCGAEDAGSDAETPGC